MECLLDAGHSGELRLESIKFSAAKLGWQLNAVWLFNKEHLAAFLQWLISDRFKPTDDCWVNSFFNVFYFMKASRPLGYGDEKKLQVSCCIWSYSMFQRFEISLMTSGRFPFWASFFEVEDTAYLVPNLPQLPPTHHDVFGETRRGG